MYQVVQYRCETLKVPGNPDEKWRNPDEMELFILGVAAPSTNSPRPFSTTAPFPQLHDAIVQRREHPRPVGVEGEALDAVGFGLKLGQHPARPCERTSGARVRALRWPRREARIARCRGALRPRTTAGRPVSRARAPSWTMQLLSAWPRDGGRPGMGVVSRSRAQRTARSRCASEQVQDESLLARKLTSVHTFEGRHEWCTKVQSSSNT